MSERKPAVVPARPSNGRGGKIGTHPDERIEINGEARAYRLVVPEKALAGSPAPLVFAFHGLGDSKDLMPIYSGLDKLAEKHGFILAYPNGHNKIWPILPLLARNDLAFFDALYAKIGAEFNIDLNRVYLTGMSNGAYFSHLLASQRSDKIAAIAAHSGGLGALGFGGKVPELKHKYAVMAIHGELDNIVNVEQGRSTRDAYTQWGHEIEYVEIKGLKHAWATWDNINAKIWKFFEAHRLNDECLNDE